MPLLTFAQKSEAPCCTILSLQQPDVIIVRNITTGQTFIFKANAQDYSNLKQGDAVSYDASTSKVVAIKGVNSSYSISQPNPQSPCCTIQNIQPNPVTPCCNFVNIHNNNTNQDFSVSVDKALAAQLNSGMSVYRLEPSGGDNVGPVDGYAGFIVGIGRSAMHYTYPIRGTAPAEDNGYSSVIAHCEIRNNEHATIIVNGKSVASYTHGSFDFDLAHYLRPGINTLTLSFESGSFSKINVIGRFPDETKGNIIYSFAPKKNALTGTYEFTYSAPKKM